MKITYLTVSQYLGSFIKQKKYPVLSIQTANAFLSKKIDTEDYREYKIIKNHSKLKWTNYEKGPFLGQICRPKYAKNMLETLKLILGF